MTTNLQRIIKNILLIIILASLNGRTFETEHDADFDTYYVDEDIFNKKIIEDIPLSMIESYASFKNFELMIQAQKIVKYFEHSLKMDGIEIQDDFDSRVTHKMLLFCQERYNNYLEGSLAEYKENFYKSRITDIKNQTKIFEDLYAMYLMCTILITALIFTLKLTNVIKFLYFGAFLFSIIVIECNETDIMALDRTYNVAW